MLQKIIWPAQLYYMHFFFGIYVLVCDTKFSATLITWGSVFQLAPELPIFTTVDVEFHFTSAC